MTRMRKALSPLEGERVGRGGCSSTILTLAFLAKAAVQQATFRLSERVWIPAFAGNTDDGKQGPLRRFAPLPPEGEDLGVLNLPPLGEVPAKPG